MAFTPANEKLQSIIFANRKKAEVNEAEHPPFRTRRRIVAGH
jgi:hypothetical protein